MKRGTGFWPNKGEAKTVKSKAVDSWKKTLLPQILQEFTAKDIYNTD